MIRYQRRLLSFDSTFDVTRDAAAERVTRQLPIFDAVGHIDAGRSSCS